MLLGDDAHATIARAYSFEDMKALLTAALVILLFVWWHHSYSHETEIDYDGEAHSSAGGMVSCYCSTPQVIQALPSRPMLYPAMAKGGRNVFIPFAVADENIAQDPSPVADVRTFKAFGLHPALSGGLRRMGFMEPSDVQQAAIPHVMGHANVAVQSYTGSGKTAVFLLPMLTEALNILDAGRPNGTHVTHLIIAPSHELCMQIVRMAVQLLGPDRQWMVQQLIGGASMERQKEGMRQKQPLLVVGTPGRMAAMLGTVVGVHYVQMVALDEADALMDRTYKEDMGRIMKNIGKKVPGGPRFLLTSASLTGATLTRMQAEWGLPEMCKILATSKVVRRSEKMKVTMSPTLTHWHVMTDPRNKIDTLRRVVVALDVPKVLVFMNEAKRLKDTLFRLTSMSKAFEVAILHSELPKEARRTAIMKFEKGEVQVLVVTDVLARGMDLACDAVVNLEVPDDKVTYAHRAGRTGRMGREGSVVTLVCPFETIQFGKLQGSLGIAIPERSLFGGALVDPSEDPTVQAGSMADQPTESEVPPERKPKRVQKRDPEETASKRQKEAPQVPKTKELPEKTKESKQGKLKAIWDETKELVVKKPESKPNTKEIRSEDDSVREDIPKNTKSQITPAVRAIDTLVPKQQRDDWRKTPWLWRERLSEKDRKALEFKEQRRAEEQKRVTASNIDEP